MMSCFVCFGSAAQDEEPRKPAAVGAGKDAAPDRAVAHIGSSTTTGPGAGSWTRPLPPADIDGPMSRLILSARRVSSSPDFADDQDPP
jgi:hypothetical protein